MSEGDLIRSFVRSLFVFVPSFSFVVRRSFLPSFCFLPSFFLSSPSCVLASFLLRSCIPSPIPFFISWFVHSFVRSFIRSFVRWFIRAVLRSFIHSCIRSFFHSSSCIVITRSLTVGGNTGPGPTLGFGSLWLIRAVGGVHGHGRRGGRIIRSLIVVV